MGILVIGGSSGAQQGVGNEAASAAHATVKPIPHVASGGGHYRVTHRTALVNAQAANARLFELRNSSATLNIVLTRLIIKWMQAATHTAAVEDSIDAFKCTSFTAVDTTNTVTPTASVKRTAGMTAVGSMAAQIRGCTAAGVAAGMTGGTLTKDGGAFYQLPKWLLASMPTAAEVKVDAFDAVDDINGTHPFVLVQNEGIIVENRVALGAAASSVVYIDCSYAEVTYF